MMNAALFATLLTLAADIAIAQRPPQSSLVHRSHSTVVEPNGASHRMSLLRFDGDVEGTVTLWEDGDTRYILKFTRNHVTKSTTISMAIVGAKEFLRATVPNDAAEDVSAPVTITAGAFTATAADSAWRSPKQPELRAKLQAGISKELSAALQTIGDLAARADSDAGRRVCRGLASLVATELSCASDPELAVLPERIDCTFDAQFGYPCRAAEQKH